MVEPSDLDRGRKDVEAEELAANAEALSLEEEEYSPPFDVTMIADDVAADEGPKDAWMITFADLLSLVLTFFILLYSMSQIKTQEWTHVVKSFNEEFELNHMPESMDTTVEGGVRKVELPRGTDLDYLYAVVLQKVSTLSDVQGVAAKRLEDRVVVSIPQALLFVPYSTELQKDAERLLFLFGDVLNRIENRVDVTAAAMAVTAKRAKYSSAWEFSLARSQVVAEVLRDIGSLRNVVSFGVGDVFVASKHAKGARSKDADVSGDQTVEMIDIVIRGLKAR